MQLSGMNRLRQSNCWVLTAVADEILKRLTHSTLNAKRMSIGHEQTLENMGVTLEDKSDLMPFERYR